MGRPLRIEYAGAFYHVLNRGQRREPIVRDGQDCDRFVSDLSRLAQQYGVRIHGYCLMTNHYHLIRETGRPGVSPQRPDVRLAKQIAKTVALLKNVDR